MVRGALNALDHFVVKNTGTKIGNIYQDLIKSCISDVSRHWEHKTANVTETAEKDGPRRKVEKPCRDDLIGVSLCIGVIRLPCMNDC